MRAINNAALAVLAALVASAFLAGAGKASRSEAGAATIKAHERLKMNANDPAGAGASVETRDIVITRIFDAPVEAVWKAWTDPEQVMRWWGPVGFTSPSCKIDFREGGKFLFCMRAPKEFQGGQDFYTAGVYNKIVPLKLIEFTQALADKDGNRIDPTTMGMPPDFPKEIRSALAFKRVGGKTELIATEYDWTVGQMLEMSESGLKECLDKLAADLARH